MESSLTWGRSRANTSHCDWSISCNSKIEPIMLKELLPSLSPNYGLTPHVKHSLVQAFIILMLTSQWHPFFLKVPSFFFFFTIFNVKSFDDVVLSC